MLIDRQAVTGLSERCNRSFKDSVERCMANIRDFPVLTRKKTLVIGQIERTKVICDYGLVNMSGICVATVYAQCPRVNQMKTDCDLQWLDPDFLLQYGHIICNNIHALEENLQCIEARTCNLEKCLMTFDPYVPSRLSTGIWKTPRYSADCGMHRLLDMSKMDDWIVKNFMINA
nr:hypothetical protein BaRGS_012626 [Batillaria attramentaria]